MNVYLICPVRNRSEKDRRFADKYVAELEQRRITVHYPPRDVDQTDDGVGLKISRAHRDAMMKCDEVHVIWNEESKGSHFDFGMAYMLQAWKKCPIVLASPLKKTRLKGYGNMLRVVAKRP